LKNNLKTEVVIQVEIPDLTIEVLEIGGQEYCKFNLAEAGTSLDPGEPMVPIIGKSYQIDPELAPSVSLRIIQSREIDLPARVLPAQENLAPEDVVNLDSINQKLYQQDRWYPQERIVSYDPVVLRDVRLLPYS